ncbi:MAG: hypothetical protein EB141_05090 [Verrucomicrobia bacterium]|nr:hypothetical protein [Verrucomicrobiota bacterium]NBU07677.1 hypothetical protein [Pseudomonadota bacterium]NDA66250.1 hypothetical protein [Verrucomicrobiota bacterium]NDB75012.1 hypothetical protein [Verrucomicrobiota bacterium]NDD37632.1 hypothetical protein [Verrucomicrobiota bacterium]
MKKLLLTSLTIAALALGLAVNATAESKGKTITLSGKGCCAKCCLKESDTCQNVLTVEKDGKKTKYYLVQNDVSKDFHSEICKTIKNITVTATCKKVGDKLELTAEKIEAAK